MHATPLMKIEDSTNLSKEDSVNIGIMFAKHYEILAQIYDQIDDGYKVSKEEAFKINNALYEAGYHDLATFMADEYFGKYFLPLKSKFETALGSDLSKKFSAKLPEVKQRQQ